MDVIPYLFFDGTCEKAINFYADTLNTDPPDIVRLRDMPPEDQAKMAGMPDDGIMNAMLRKGAFKLMASDTPPGEWKRMEGVSIHLGLDSVEDAHRVFAAFAEGGDVGMPISQTSWTSAFGTVRDRFGTRWMVSVAEGAE